MNITLRFFGQLRELTGKQEHEMTVKDNILIEDLEWLLGQRFPQIKEHLETSSFSINEEYVSGNAKVNAGDIVGILPPISGGAE